MVMHLSLSHFCTSKQPLTHNPVKNHDRTYWSTKLDFGGCRTLFSYWFPVWIGMYFFQITSGRVLRNKVLVSKPSVKGLFTSLVY